MNPQDARTNADRLRVRNDYLAVLRQQEANLQKTANAMTIMAQTGQPPIPPTDTRSMSEKLVDIERLKPMFRKQLMSLMDGKEVERVMGELDNVELQSAIMIFGEIYNELKGKYPLGVPAPIFIDFLRRFLKDYNKSLGFLPKSKEERDALTDADAIAGTQRYLRFQQAETDREMADTGLARELRNQENRDIIAENQSQEKYYQAFNTASPEEIYATAQNITGKTTPSPRALALAKRVLGFDKLTPNEIFKYTNPSQGELISYLEYDYFRNYGGRFSKVEKVYLGRRTMQELENDFSKIRGGENIWGGEELVENVEQEFINPTAQNINLTDEPPVTYNEMLDAMETLGANPTTAQIASAIRRARGRPRIYPTEADAKAAKAEKQRVKRRETQLFSSSGKAKYKKNILAYSGAAEFQGLSAVALPEKIDAPSRMEVKMEVPDYMTMSYSDFNRLDDDIKVDLMGRFTSTNLFETLDQSNKTSIYNAIKYYDNPTDVMGRDEAIELLEDVFQAIRQTDIRNIIGYGLVSNARSAATGAAKHTKKLIVGRGLPEALFSSAYEKGKKDFSEKIDKSNSSLPETKSYVPFGKYVLNHRRLADNKLMVRTIKGGAVTGIPTLAISPVLGGIIKKMVGGALPSYNEMSKLSEEEQNTLYKIFKISEVDNVDMLPAPNKTKEEEEFNRFQILKGQILAGNDSKELIKEFKVMLLKFIHNGKVPRGQGMEIVCDLMALGH